MQYTEYTEYTATTGGQTEGMCEQEAYYITHLPTVKSKTAPKSDWKPGHKSSHSEALTGGSRHFRNNDIAFH